MTTHNTSNLAGQRFGKLTVIARAGTHRLKQGTVSLWRCRCDCGREEDIQQTVLPNTAAKQKRKDARWACSICSNTRTCIICDKSFYAPNGQVTCSDECRRIRTNQLAEKYYWQDVQTGKQRTRQKQAWVKLINDPERHRSYNARIRERRQSVPGVAESINQRQRTRRSNLSPEQHQNYLEQLKTYYRGYGFSARRERTRQKRLAEFMRIGETLSRMETKTHTWRQIDLEQHPTLWKQYAPALTRKSRNG